MGRNKRKIRWRRLSIGGNSGNEDEDNLESQDGETSSTHPNLTNNNSPSKINNSLSHRQRSGSQPCMINHSFSTNKPAGTGVDQNSSSTSTTGPSSPNMLTSSKQPLHNGGGGNSSSNSHSPSDNGTTSDNCGGSGYDDHNHRPRRPQPPYDNHYRYASAQSGTNYHTTKETRGDHPRYGGYHNANSGYGGYQSSNNYYNNHHRNSYNNYRNSSSHYDSGGGSGGYRGNGYGPPPPSSRYAGRFRKPRPYSSNSYYYQNGPHSQTSGLNGENKPSYNQEEYTKITTPRQDVLFKKGYLATRKAAVTSGSVDSGTSGPPTPSASTNGTPDTHSINGIHSDYPESYETGETDGVVGGYDDTVYYGPPAEAVFTDPNTGQIYYGQCSPNGEYFDAYPVSPVMVTAGYPGPAVYYQLPYPVSAIDWNGTPIYPVVTAGPPAIPLDNTILPTELTQGVDTGIKNYPAQSLSCPPKINAKGESSDEFSTDGGPTPGADKPNNESANSSSATNGPIHSEPTTKGTKLVESSSKGIGKKKESQDSGTVSDASSTSSTENSTLSSSTSPPLSPKEVGLTTPKDSQLCTSMSNLNLNNNVSTQEVPTIHHHLPHHHALPTFLAPVPVATPTHVHGHGPPPPLQPILFTPHPHPGTFASYGPPIYNGVVVPLTPVVPTTPTSPESNLLDIRQDTDSQKYCKKKRRKKDSGQGQLTDESSDDSTNTTTPTPTSISINDKRKPDTDKDTTQETLINQTDTNNLISRSVNSSPIKQPNAEINLKLDDEQEQETNFEITKSSEKEEALKLDEITSDKIIKHSDSDSTNNAEKTNNNKAEENNTTSSDQSENQSIKDAEKNTTTTATSGCSTSNKPIDLVLELFSPINPSPLEPSSPDVDSLNTTQSVAGSEAPSFGNSISESDYNNYMNRTTSVDEVEDIESEQSQEDQPEFSHGRLESVKLSPLEISLPTLPTEAPKENNSPTSSPPHTPKNSTEATPSPEALFERQLEPPLLEIPFDKISVERTSPVPELENEDEIEPFTQTKEPEPNFKILEATCSESDDIIQTICETFTKESEPITQVVKVKITEAEPIIQAVGTSPPEIRIAETLDSNIDNENLESEVPESLIPTPSETLTTPAATEERPTSLTVAISEWLKATGPDALTPVAQLRAQFDNAEDGDVEDSENDESESEESLTADDLASNEQNQKNLHGNLWGVLSNNNREIVLQVACLTSTPKTNPPMLKMSEETQHKDESSDSGLESSVSSPESTPSKEFAKKIIIEPDQLPHGRKLSSTFSFDDNFELDNPHTEEACNPTKFSKYYQFGVVFDDFRDQGIEMDETNLEVEIGENGAPIIIYTNPQAEPEAIYDEETDEEEVEEIGTFDPEFVKHKQPIPPPTPPEMNHSDDEQEYVRSNHKTTTTIPSTHLYVNPFSLAHEMGVQISKVPLFPQSPEEELPDYVSPPAPELSTESHVVFNPNSSTNIIRTQFGLPHGICCVIQ